MDARSINIPTDNSVLFFYILSLFLINSISESNFLRRYFFFKKQKFVYI